MSKGILKYIISRTVFQLSHSICQTRKRGNCECIASWRRPPPRQSFSALNTTPCQVWSRWTQWRRQDLLRGGAIGAKIQIISWGTHGELQGRVQQLLDDYSFVTDAVMIERAVMSCWHLHQLFLQTTQYLDSWLSYLFQSELKMKLLEVEGARVPVSHSWRRHWLNLSIAVLGL